MTVYRERLWPSPGLFIALLLVIPASLLVFLPINPDVGIVVAIVLYLGAAGTLIITSPVISITDGHLRAGSASLPLEFVGEPAAYRGEEATAQRGRLLDARAWLVIRGWVDPIVKVPVTDPSDPAPYWILSSRRPDALMAAIVTATAEH